MLCHLVSDFFDNSNRILNIDIREIDGFYGNVCYGENDRLTFIKKHWSTWVGNGFFGKSLGLGKNHFGNAGTLCSWFLAPKSKCSLVFNDYGLISAKRNFKNYSGEHRVIKLNDSISLSEGKTVCPRFSIDWTKTFEGVRIPYRKQDRLDCDNEKVCREYIMKPKMNCFNCELERA